ncbi:MAG: polysaccharide deacetylase family protein [Candidatus Bathyarchaeia archaeon]
MLKPFIMTVDMDPPPWSAPNLDIEKGTTDILRLFQAHGVHATFFVPASVALAFPELIQKIKGEGHEIACHGLKHDANEAISSLDEQCHTIRNATNIIESIAGSKPIGFRAPLFRSNANCRTALRQNNYVYDSSMVCSPFFGNPKIRLLSKPFFFPCSNHHAECNLLEIPVSVNPFLPFPLGGAYLRILGSRWARMGIRTNLTFNAPIVFYVHPKDVIHIIGGPYWYSSRNTANCMKGLEDIILYGKRTGAKFMKAQELAELHIGTSTNA